MGIIKDLFFYANSNIIKIIDVRTEVNEGESVDIDVNGRPEAICTY